ncbi:hypothetical protein [Pedobacter mendelii]|uniref:Uncharacterized protein n=1 Tax=Pedobacter mendelii TaxID=1908240 RepID=A0ABQ2BNR5_9SPHI|nr:hypothetical protein [Pedobacter mendelii]GGI29056.1 hypothetical protein GCM10008119_35730 [Pedobacter mendelii]
MKHQQIIKHNIKKNQYLGDIELFKTFGIPTDSILFKILPGCGATSLEITFHRHSIILEPNVPVIIGKANQYKEKVCAIYEGVKVDKILDYLNNEVQFKKLIVTPESFGKVKEAIEESRFNLYTDFFLLFDECEKIIQDISYRKAISLPMDDFFMFDKKAFVSATPILPSDPRFKANNFQIHQIEPAFKYAQDIQLITSNNILTSLTKFINDNPRDKYFIFFNSTDTIDEVIKKLKIQDESLVFCADKSRRKLILNDYKKTSVKTEISAPFKKYNFFTSRFFSAVDIEYDLYQFNPTIIMVTDLVSALHSMIDPFTEAVQIQGRFRKPMGKAVKREIIHISNIDSELTSMSREETLKYLEECHIVYGAVNRYYHLASTLNAKEVLWQMLKRIDYAKFLKPNTEERDYDMADNLIFEEMVKGYYKSKENLVCAYNDCTHFNLLPLKSERYTYTDKKRKRAQKKGARLKTMNEILTDGLMELHSLKENNKITDFHFNMELASYQLDFPDQMAPINRFGIDRAAAFKFDIRAIEQQLDREKKDVDHFAMMTHIHAHFTVGRVYTNSQIQAINKPALDLNKIHGTAGGVKYLRKFAKLSEDNNRKLIKRTPDGKELRGYKLFHFLDNPSI